MAENFNSSTVFVVLLNYIEKTNILSKIQLLSMLLSSCFEVQNIAIFQVKNFKT